MDDTHAVHTHNTDTTSLHDLTNTTCSHNSTIYSACHPKFTWLFVLLYSCPLCYPVHKHPTKCEMIHVRVHVYNKC